MTPTALIGDSTLHLSRTRIDMLKCVALFLALSLPSIALAQTDASGTAATACTFFQTVNTVLNVLSMIIVTIAIVFTGYKVAFAHSRISEVAPVLIGAVLIGAASQIAKIFLSNSATSAACTATTSVVTHALDHYAVVVHILTHYA